MIRLNFEGHINGKLQKFQADPKLYARKQASREDWKVFAHRMANEWPDVVKKKPNGNGTHIDILGYHFQATGSFSLVVYANDFEGDNRVSFSMYYNQIRTIDVDEDSGLIIINDRIAIK
jgi:hypothetical protein